MADIQRRAWAQKKKVAKRVRKAALLKKSASTPKSLAREELHRLARIGAAQELIDLEKRITKLKLFLSV